MIDLTELSLIDTSGLALMVRAGNTRREKGRKFVIVGSGPQVRRAFELTGLSELLPVVHAREDALALLGSE